MAASLLDTLKKDLVGFRAGLIQFWGSVSMRPDDNVFQVKRVELKDGALVISGTDEASGGQARWTLSIEGAQASKSGADAVEIAGAIAVKGSFGEHVLAGRKVRVTDDDGTREYAATGPSVRFQKAMV